MEAAGAIFAENEALRWLADLAASPESSGGVFVSGGTAGNLSALVAARGEFRHRTGHQGRGAILTSAGAHASIAQAGYVMDVDVISVPGGSRLTGEDLGAFLSQRKADLSGSSRSSGQAVRLTLVSLMTSTRSPMFAAPMAGGCTSMARTGAQRTGRAVRQAIL